jgi:hypothetical protein
LTPQIQVNPELDRKTQQRKVIRVYDDVVNTINNKTANIKISQIKRSPHKTTTHTSEDSSTMIYTNDALRNIIDDGTTQSFGTDVSNGDESEKEKEEERESATYKVLGKEVEINPPPSYQDLIYCNGGP